MPGNKNISPLLDGFTIGAPISEHHGVVCCPAIKENKKYIVKMITLPPSQMQFDAMLLAGAYKDPGDAMEYFRDQGESLLQEAELLKKLSRIEGFLPYDGWQMEAITRRRLGYEVYLVGSYKRSLDKYMRKNAFTHLEAVNLALDLCAALSVCRQAGFLYADLKPNNIYVSEKKEYRIGDLGFLSLDALRYASLPERYFSPYTPPELLDPMASMNLTVDTYAVGMLLYQLYNDGQLPFTGAAPLESLPSPCHADYEMAEIIMKAIHVDPDQRWTDPKDLGKAIASYMQRNRVNDIPITPFIPLDVKPEDIVPISELKSDEEVSEPCAAEPEIEEPSALSDASDNEMETIPEVLTSEEEKDSTVATAIEEEEYSEAEPAPTDDPGEPQISEDAISEEIPVEAPHIQEENKSDEIAEDRYSDITLSEEVSKIISKADDIISHEIPEESLFPTEDAQTDPFAFATDDSEDLSDDFPEDPLMEDMSDDQTTEKKKTTKHFEDPTRKNKLKKFVSGCFTVLLLGGLSVGGFWGYKNVYLQTIDSISVSGTQEQITVLIDTGIEESKLTAYCADENGKRHTASVQGGKATFTGLKPSTQYTIELDISGFHKLTGETSDVFTTDATTQVVAFEAIAGSEDGSVILNFTVDGGEPDFWNIRYWTEGEDELVETVTGHSATITGLTVGKVYTFTLDGGKHFDLGGETSIEYLASRLILADAISVTSSEGSDITVNWRTPGDVVVENWNVRCYDGYGFEEQVTVTENQVQFTGIDPSSKYTVEITAAGMTQPSSIHISADPIHVTDFQVDESEQTEMKITWKYTGNDPEGGWILFYTVDGSGTQEIECTKNSATIAPLIPGANYEFVLQSADTRTVFNNMISHKAADAEKFSENAFVSENVSMDLLRTPEDSNWHFETIGEDSFTNTFAAGDSASLVLRSSTAVYLPGYKTKALFVFRDSYGNVLPELVAESSFTWKNIWLAGDSRIGELDLPALPTLPGNYIIELYFNGCSVGKFDLTITQ